METHAALGMNAASLRTGSGEVPFRYPKEPETIGNNVK